MKDADGWRHSHPAWSGPRSTARGSSVSRRYRNEMQSATYHICQMVLPVLFTSDIEHVLSRPDGLRAKGKGECLTHCSPPPNAEHMCCGNVPSHPLENLPKVT